MKKLLFMLTSALFRRSMSTISSASFRLAAIMSGVQPDPSWKFNVNSGTSRSSMLQFVSYLRIYIKIFALNKQRDNRKPVVRHGPVERQTVILISTGPELRICLWNNAWEMILGNISKIWSREELTFRSDSTMLAGAVSAMFPIRISRQLHTVAFASCFVDSEFRFTFWGHDMIRGE